MQDNWQSFLEQQSAQIVDGLVTGFGDSPAEQHHGRDDNIITDLSRLDVVEIKGEDAADFLHGQLSSDISALAENTSQQSSWCNIKGRVIASFLLYRSPDCFYLLLERELTDKVVKRLQMFVLRSDVSIKNRSNELIRIGLRGELLHKQFQLYPGSSDAGSMVLKLQDTIPRSIILCGLDQAISLWQQFSVAALPVGSGQWRTYDIEAGMAWVGEAGSEEFLPQSLNLDLLGGLSFDKGCYPGQEIIARMHFRGKLKQRMFVSRVSVNEAAGTRDKLFIANVKAHVGMVVNAVQISAQHCLMLVVVDLEHSDNTNIHVGSEDGPALELLSQPYSLDS